MIKQSEFRPTRWLQNPHLQTLWPLMCKRQTHLPLKQEILALNNSQITLTWVDSGRGPLVMILHGLGGSLRSAYIKNILLAINGLGWRAVLMHFRGKGQGTAGAVKSHHAVDTQILQQVIETLYKREPELELALVGYSMGGSTLLRWLGQSQIRAPIFAATAISVPFDVATAAQRVNCGFSKLYQWWLLKTLGSDLRANYVEDNTPFPITSELLQGVKDFSEFDDLITAPLHGFSCAQEYYAHTSSRPFLKYIQVPTLLLHAQDDPFMTPEVIPCEDELSEHVLLEVSESGGHVGFVTGNVPWQTRCWLSQRIPAFLQQQRQAA